MTQGELAARTQLSRSTISRIERGHIGALSIDAVRSIGAVLEVRVDLVPHWRGGELDRLLNARHSAFHEALATWFADTLPDWQLAPEVSFSIYGERGVVDVLGWHAASRAILIVELKTELVDVQETLGTLDRKRRLARAIAAERGWTPAIVGVWLAFADSDMNRMRVAAHRQTLGAALPQDRMGIRAWLRRPAGSIAAHSFFVNAHPRHINRPIGGIRRVRRVRVSANRA